MASLNHYIYDIKNIASGGITSDDFSIADEQIKFWFNAYRSVLIRQELSERTTVSNSYIQHIIVEFEKIDIVEFCGTTTSDCYVLKSKNKIPKTIRRNDSTSILAVQSLDEKVSFSETNFAKKLFDKYNKYTPNLVRWYIKDDYMYLTNNTKIKWLKLSLILEDPQDAKNFQCSGGINCYPDDDAEYPVSLDLGSKITDMIIKLRLQPMGIALKRDEINDGTNLNQPQLK